MSIAASENRLVENVPLKITYKMTHYFSFPLCLDPEL